MPFRFEVALITVASTLLIGTAAPASTAVEEVETYKVLLTGQAEVGNAAAPGLAGDEDGSGRVELAVDPSNRQVCYAFTLSKLATPLMAHIHRAPVLRNGPTVVTLFTGPGGNLDGCVTWTEHRLAEIVANPSNFYVNLSTTEYPDGALRGQLTS
jgi:hypothetical protein